MALEIDDLNEKPLAALLEHGHWRLNESTMEYELIAPMKHEGEAVIRVFGGISAAAWRADPKLREGARERIVKRAFTALMSEEGIYPE